MKRPVILFTFLVAIVAFSLLFLKESFSQLYLGSSSRCFSCERELPDPIKWVGQPTKSFDAEAQLSAAAPYWGAYGGKTSCFSCQRQLAEMDRLNMNIKKDYDPYSSWRFPGSYVD